MSEKPRTLTTAEKAEIDATRKIVEAGPVATAEIKAMVAADGYLKANPRDVQNLIGGLADCIDMQARGIRFLLGVIDALEAAKA